MIKCIITNFTVEQITLMLAFATLIITSIFYFKTFKLTKKELAQNKEQYKDQLSIARRQFNEQQKSIRIQQFENTLFNMINLQQEITEGIQLHNKAQGRDTFWFFFEKPSVFLNEDIKDDIIPEILHSCKDILQKKGIKGFEQINQLVFFDHYFNHMYSILMFIDNASFLDNDAAYIDERYKYVTILKATLSPHELALLFYYSISEHGMKIKSFIEKYSILENLRQDILPRSPHPDGFSFEDKCGDYCNFQTNDKTEVNRYTYYFSAFEKDVSLFKSDK